MERDSIVYKTRRKIQRLAHKFVSNEALSKLYFKIVLHKKLNLKVPKTFNEKIQWMKLYYCPKNSLLVNCSDKYAVREYVEKKGYGDKSVPLLGVWEHAEDIEWDALPDQFVLKCNHGCAYNIVVTNKNTVDKLEVIKQLNRWLKDDFGSYNVEIHYSEIQRRVILCEEFLGENVMDYKFFCFHGSPHCIYVAADLIHDRQASIGFFYLDGQKMPLYRDDYTDIPSVELPPFFEEMKKAAEDLCQDFPFVRVDFFVTKDAWYFSELTFTPGAGMMPFNPDEVDMEWGNMLDISNL